VHTFLKNILSDSSYKVYNTNIVSKVNVTPYDPNVMTNLLTETSCTLLSIQSLERTEMLKMTNKI